MRLRPDQYEKLMRWKCLCDVYVNSLGDICIRQFGRAPLPPGETVFGTTDWLDSYDRDQDGYPVFQGVRGARVKITSSFPPAEMSSSSSCEMLFTTLLDPCRDFSFVALINLCPQSCQEGRNSMQSGFS